MRPFVGLVTFLMRPERASHEPDQSSCILLQWRGRCERVGGGWREGAEGLDNVQCRKPSDGREESRSPEIRAKPSPLYAQIRTSSFTPPHLHHGSYMYEYATARTKIPVQALRVPCRACLILARTWMAAVGDLPTRASSSSSPNFPLPCSCLTRVPRRGPDRSMAPRRDTDPAREKKRDAGGKREEKEKKETYQVWRRMSDFHIS